MTTATLTDTFTGTSEEITLTEITSVEQLEAVFAEAAIARRLLTASNVAILPTLEDALAYANEEAVAGRLGAFEVIARDRPIYGGTEFVVLPQAA